jgi:hypothetical protein
VLNGCAWASATVVHRRAQALGLTAVVSGVLALTGCSTRAETLVHSSHAFSPTVAPTQSVDTNSGPVVVAPPTSAAQAIVDANQSLLGYYKASFTSGHEGGTRLDLVTPWVTGSALRNEQILAGFFKQKHYRLDGSPTVWSLRTSLSSAAQSKETSGAPTAYGSVQLEGCAESMNRPVGNGAPAWTSKGRKFKQIWSVLYDAGRKQWIVAAAVPIDSDGGGTSCG